ncbi:hypothetical protein PMAYCL1PPCAC_18757 [Pristionchus mayeri]|uniref:Peptidase S72 domain-containing protein n=1 Tax=Pristionchus mayeri TaxID=1317129 RepID=A0AAN5CQG9_9BILA|nr:hypothetical protein PMAYCL1PPCAC_18757 [Pristionchus mayeri]
MTRLPSLCLLMALSVSWSLAAPTKGMIEVAIGEPHEIPVPINVNITGPIEEPLPSWMVKDYDMLKMIAPPDALPSYLVVMGQVTMEIKVKENEPTGCASDEWADLLVDGAPLEHWDTIKELEKNVDISMSNIRVVPRSYANVYRQTNEVNDKGTEQTVIIVKMDCGQSVNPIIEMMYELFPESDHQISMSHGSILSRSVRNEDANSILSSFGEGSTDEPEREELHLKNETTTIASTTTTRQTRSTSVAIVPIKAIRCKQGSYCLGELEDKTFLGPDGGVHSFNLTIEHLNGAGGVDPWVMREGKRRSIGVIPLVAGEHTFRLSGTDKGTRKLTAPFSIFVDHDEPKNHQFKMTMHSLPHEPEMLHTTLVKLANVLRRNVDEIKVANVTRLDGSAAIVTYWNTSLPTTSCPVKEVSQFLRGLHRGDEVAHEFAKAFANKPTIHPARIEVEWMGKCEAAAAEEVKTAGGVGGSKGEEPLAEETEGSLSTLITVVCLLALLFALLILIVCCVACKKSKTHKTGVNEYMSKGTPVVFPDEVEDEHEDVPATAPMLVKEERPPLRVSEHSNPLYKPPPPLASTAASPRPSAAPSAHKLPPPYVPP